MHKYMETGGRITREQCDLDIACDALQIRYIR